MSPLGDRFSAGESAAYLFILGSIESLSAPKDFVEYLFGEFTLLSNLTVECNFSGYQPNSG